MLVCDGAPHAAGDDRDVGASGAVRRGVWGQQAAQGHMQEDGGWGNRITELQHLLQWRKYYNYTVLKLNRLT